MAQIPVDPFDDMNDIFNQMMGGLNGFNTENRRYLINGREVTPEEYAQYRRTGKLPQADAKQPTAKAPKKGGMLAKLGRNLTEEAKAGKLDPVIGRNKEIQETAEILSRRIKNNPVLVGDAGVGKTAVVEDWLRLSSTATCQPQLKTSRSSVSTFPVWKPGRNTGAALRKTCKSWSMKSKKPAT